MAKKKAKPVTAKKPKRYLASLIAHRLFNSGMGQGDRLAIRRSKGEPGGGEIDLGGWCRDAAINQIVNVLTEAGY